MGFYFFVDTQNIYVFFLLSFFLGIFSPLSNVSFLSSIPFRVSSDKIAEYNRKYSVTYSISMVFGMAAGGAFYSIIGIKNVLLLDALSFLIFSVILFLTIGSYFSNGVEKSEAKSFGLKEEWNILKEKILHSPLLQYLYGTRMADAFGSSSHLLGIPILVSLLDPNKAPIWMSLIWGTWAFGQIIGVIAIKKFGPDQIQFFIRSYFASTLGMSAFFIFLFFFFPHLIAFIGSFAAGFFDGISEVSLNTILHKQASEIQGRLFGLVNFFVRIGFAMGMLLVTFFMGKLGTKETVFVFHGCICIVYNLLYRQKRSYILNL